MRAGSNHGKSMKAETSRQILQKLAARLELILLWQKHVNFCPQSFYSKVYFQMCSHFASKSALHDANVSQQLLRVLLHDLICDNVTNILKSTSVYVCFRGISRLSSAFFFLRWFKLAHISLQVCTFHDGCKQGIDQQIFFYLNTDFSANSIWIRTEDA